MGDLFLDIIREMIMIVECFLDGVSLGMINVLGELWSRGFLTFFWSPSEPTFVGCQPQFVARIQHLGLRMLEWIQREETQ
jgi:hypothetical protein